jgi:hypothetical protein
MISMKPISYIQLQNKYAGKFIATYEGKVIASARTSKRLFEKIKYKLGDKDLLIQRIDPKGAVCVYRISSDL